jgi:hypothetical protein
MAYREILLGYQAIDLAPDREQCVDRHNWTSPARTKAAAVLLAIYTLIETAKLNDLDPQVWLAHLLARLLDHPAKRITELLHGIGARRPGSLNPPDFFHTGPVARAARS